ncbi:MAG: N-acetylmuramoyl-L-alanine amidase [Proteobacteria bacterium]|nr:N-acetylmuramoyl-L-alanine amidase [Pseudomonadota bacterium]
MAVFLLALGLATSTPVLAAEAVVTDIRVGTHGSATRIVFELTRRVSFSTFLLADPYRIVIDLPEVGWRLPPRPLPAAIGVFRKLRYGLFKPGNSRIVLEVRSPAAISQAFILEPDEGRRYRLVLDLTPSTREAFLSQIGARPVSVTSAQPAPNPGPSALVPPPGAKVEPPGMSVGGGSPQKPVLVKGRNPAALVARAQASPFRLAPRKPEAKRPGKKHVIVIDPGHGGADPGTIGLSGIYEKHVTLSMARELKRQLQRTGRFKVRLTRDRDIFIRLRNRVQIARDVNAELFISVHADTVKNRKIRGPSVYTLSEKASDREAAELADKENKADLIAGVDLTHETPEVTNILIDLAQRESMNQSARFAALLVKELRRKTKVLRNTHRFAGFAVLKAPDVPSVLLELGFLSNPKDERALRSRHYRSKLAAAVVKAAEAYFVRVEEAARR